MSKQISKSVGGSSPARLEHPTAAKSEFSSMSQLPAQQVSYAPQPMSAAEGSYMSSQMPQPMVQTTGPSATIPAGNLNRKPNQPAGGSENQRGCRTYKVCDLIDALSWFMPYPPKEDAAATLSDVIDYIKQTEGEIQQLEGELSWLQFIQQSQLTAGMQYQGTAAQGDIPSSPIRLAQIPNQMVGTHVVPAMGFPVNQAAADAAAVVNQAADAADVVNQAADAAAPGVQASIQENLAFGETNDQFFNPVI